MKAIAFLNRTVVATLLVSASIAAFAGGGPRGAGPYPYSGTAAMAVAAERADPAAGPANAVPTAVRSVAHDKTREQVRAELLQAEEAGLIPVHRNDYCQPIPGLDTDNSTTPLASVPSRISQFSDI
ncbi:DUF4148 domain-containing protein [Burkholderia diffusa]|uniref:DUF4148 domain-containing protein n=1 Tax=Burkholderia diffusa TaxID=488732 RepID=UPI002AB177B3|nr:DUF4148 domain-containing protein [Burkholderia diffusa]